MTVVLIGGFVGALVMAILQQSYFNAYVWFGEISVFFALVTYIAVNLASISFYRRFRPQKFNVVWNLIVPIVGIGIDLYILWQSFFVALMGSGFALGQSVVLFAVVWWSYSHGLCCSVTPVGPPSLPGAKLRADRNSGVGS